MRSRQLVRLTVAATIAAFANPVLAEEAPAPEVATLEDTPAPAPPAAPARPGLTMPAGKLNIAVNLEAGLSKDRAFEPVSAAPDFAYGVTQNLTVALVHSGFAATGFRGNAGGGVCITGDSHGCAKVYNRAGLEGWYSLARGTMQAAAVVGVHASPIDPLRTQLKLGAKSRIGRGKLFATWLPSLFIGLNERAAGNQDTLWSPVSVGFKATPTLSLALGTGFKGPLDGFADKVTVATGIIGTFAISKQAMVGASFFLPNALGGSAVPEASKGSELRFVQLWAAYTL